MLVLRLRPWLIVHCHQPLTVVDDSRGRLTVEMRSARLTGWAQEPRASDLITPLTRYATGGGFAVARA